VSVARGNLLVRAYHELIGYAAALRHFRAESANAFSYLVTEFGFQPLEFEETGYGALCRFENSTTVVEEHLDWTEELVYVYVRPRADGQSATAIGPPGVLLDAILVHAGKRPEKQIGVLNHKKMKSTLQEYARGLRVHAANALRGDFRELRAIRAARPEANWRLLGPRARDG
jgi:hypothetical protein